MAERALSLTDAREQLTDAVNRAAYTGERTIIERHGRPVAALVSVEDLELLRAQPIDAEEEDKTKFRAAMAEAMKRHAPTLRKLAEHDRKKP